MKAAISDYTNNAVSVIIMSMKVRWSSAAFILFALPLLVAAASTSQGYVEVTASSGDEVLVPDDRKPSLYT